MTLRPLHVEPGGISIHLLRLIKPQDFAQVGMNREFDRSGSCTACVLATDIARKWSLLNAAVDSRLFERF